MKSILKTVVSFHLYTYKSNRFILLPIVSSVMGLYFDRSCLNCELDWVYVKRCSAFS
jgi:hypothetical protein